jgi:hypothetical protein
VIRNRWFDIPLLLLVTAIMFRPGFFAGLVGVANKNWMYLAGMALYGVIFAWQKMRGGMSPAMPVNA